MRRLYEEFSIYKTEDYILKKFVLLTFTLICMLCMQNSSQAADVNSVKASIVKHAVEMGVDPALALSIARTESGFRHEARSPHGAVGVYQLMPSTAKRLGVNPYSLNDNIRGGIMYYKMMYKMFGSIELALAAYNAGPGNVKKYNSVPPYAETKRFVSKIMADYNRQKINPDPAVLNAKAPPKTLSNPVMTPVPAPVPDVPVKETDELQAEVFDDSPLELDLKTQTLAI